MMELRKQLQGLSFLDHLAESEKNTDTQSLTEKNGEAIER